MGKQTAVFAVLFGLIAFFIGIGEILLANGVSRSYVQFLFGTQGLYPGLIGPFGLIGCLVLWYFMRWIDAE